MKNSAKFFPLIGFAIVGALSSYSSIAAANCPSTIINTGIKTVNGYILIAEDNEGRSYTGVGGSTNVRLSRATATDPSNPDTPLTCYYYYTSETKPGTPPGPELLMRLSNSESYKFTPSSQGWVATQRPDGLRYSCTANSNTEACTFTLSEKQAGRTESNEAELKTLSDARIMPFAQK